MPTDLARIWNVSNGQCLAAIPILNWLERNPSIRKTIFICLALNLVIAAPILVMTLT